MIFIKRIISVFLWMTMVSFLAFADSLFDDALELTHLVYENKAEGKSFDNQKKREAVEILRKYVTKEQPNVPEDVIGVQNLYADNPFISANDALIPLPSGELEGQTLSSVPEFTSIGAYLTGLDLGTIATGMTDFLIYRAQEELYSMFFTEFYDELTQGSVAPYLKPLLSDTYRILTIMHHQGSNYSQYIGMLRSAFIKDLTLTGDRLPDLARSIVGDGSGSKIPEMIEASLTLVKLIERGAHPMEMLENPYLRNQLRNIDPTLEQNWATVNLVLRSLRISSTTWVELQDFLAAGANPNFRTIFLGLVYQEAQKEDLQQVTEYLKNFVSEPEAMDQYFRKYAVILRSLGRAQDFITNSEFKNVGISEYLSLINGFLGSVIEAQVNILESSSQSLTVQNEFRKYSVMAMDVFIAIQVRDYGTALTETGTLLALVFGEENVRQYETFLSLYYKYGGFLMEIASAQSPQEIDLALRRVALPPGSAALKKQTASSVTINGYLGAVGGTEFPDLANKDTPGAVFGIWAPVGIAVNKALKPASEDGMSISGFLSLVDLGAIAIQRIGSDTNIKDPSNITITDIFAPGLNLILGLPRMPISTGIGVQVGPTIQSIATNDHPVNLRIHLFMAVDIPIMNLYVRK